MRAKSLIGWAVVACGAVVALVGAAVLIPRFAMQRGSVSYDESVRKRNRELNFDNWEPEIVKSGDEVSEDGEKQ